MRGTINFANIFARHMNLCNSNCLSKNQHSRHNIYYAKHLYIVLSYFHKVSSCHRQNVKENNPHTHKRQIDVSRGKLSMDASPEPL